MKKMMADKALVCQLLFALSLNFDCQGLFNITQNLGEEAFGL
jgi:hypothetical protein